MELTTECDMKLQLLDSLEARQEAVKSPGKLQQGTGLSGRARAARGIRAA